MSANNNPAVAASLTQTKAVYDRLQGQIDTLAQTVHVSHNVITSSVTSWADVQAIVRGGLADKAFPIGTKMYCRKDNVTLEWDVIGIDHDTPADPQFTHSLTLQLHDCFPTFIQFDAPEALYYCETGLEAGTYHFTLSGTDYQFTASADIAAGSQLMLAFTGNVPSGITVADTKGGAVSEGSITVTAGSGGTALDTDYLNDINRVIYGSNNYKESAVRQWLGSSAATGSVWTPQNDFDRPPDWTSTANGFMNGMDGDFLAVLGNVTKVTAAPGSNTPDTTTDPFFLLSRSEVYGGLENGVDEGAPYPYYANYSNLSSAGTGADANRVKYIGSTACQQFLRTPAVGQSSRVRHLNVSGQASGSQVAVNGSNPDYVAPACCII
ncbi:MAG: hypothetical protein II828_04925 [Clostridia bacterium]|nr:hypothetical protein [Clostridia bacterium]